MRRVSRAKGSSWRRETWRVSSSSLIVVVIRKLHSLDIEIERLAEANPGVRYPSIELNELGRIELRPHQLLFHGLLGLPCRIARESIVLIVESAISLCIQL